MCLIKRASKKLLFSVLSFSLVLSSLYAPVLPIALLSFFVYHDCWPPCLDSRDTRVLGPHRFTHITCGHCLFSQYILMFSLLARNVVLGLSMGFHIFVLDFCKSIIVSTVDALSFARGIEMFESLLDSIFTVSSS